ncbi:hypothetical protein KP509_28G049500 [Ceratopteris richardii]|uniref:Saposin B-type domain-containing protein n=1 Tax=Ceratopteris richardii TaxID=49495 RepID=A0A8T2RDS4_CERRI|nr:hypothetical protein KP509_28G049500 [Ceratopteris richardii]
MSVTRGRFQSERLRPLACSPNSDLPDFEKSVQFLESETQKLRFPHVEDIQSVVCQSCMDISTSAERVLLDPHTRNSVIEYVNGSLCRNLPLHQEECQNLAATYVPNLMDAMQFYAAPTKLCGETKLCPSSAILPQYDERICKMCRVLAEEALIYAQDCKTEMEILDVFHAQCEKFGIFAPKCHMLVDTFAPYYIGKLNSLTAEEVCQKAQMCEPLCIKDPSSCATCQFLVFQLKLKFQNPAVQEKLLHTLIEQCEKVPVHVDQCKDIVKRYGPYIFENLDSLLKPELVCEEIHACEGKKKIAEGMRVQLPDAQYGNVAYH